MKLPRKEREERSATIAQTLWLVLACSGLCVLTAYASDPSWWSSPGTGAQSAVLAPQVTTNNGVVTTNYAPNEYATVSQGQLKQFTARSIDYLNGTLSGGAGTNLNTMASNWAADYATNGYGPTNIKPSDYTAMNVGQLKSMASLVYGRLSAAGYTELTPSWLHQNTNTDNVAANLGQLKQVFDFDLSLPGASNLTATAGAAGTLNLSWTLPGTNNATAWLIEQQNGDGTWSVLTNWANPTATSYAVTGLTDGQTYHFQVIGSDANSVSLPVSVSGTPTSSAPILSPAPGRYLSSQTITVTSPISGATLYYTTDGTDPTTSSSSMANGGQLTVNSTTLYKFIAVSDSTTSSETTALYGIGGSSDLQAGDSFTLTRKPDGTVWTWGDDSRGQQGDNQANNLALHPQQVPNLTGIIGVAAAGDHALALKNDGTVWAWGANDQSQSGNGGTSDLLVPTQVTGLSNIAALYAGEFQGFAVDASGNLYAWGANGQGQLGDGTTNNQGSPEAISSITNVVKVVSGSSHTLVLKSDGTVWATGSNAAGQLGDGTYNNASTFQPIPGLVHVVDIAAGGNQYGDGHSMALLADGSVWTWGTDWNGELGDGNFGPGTTTPEPILLPTGAVAVVAVDTKSYVVLADGTVRGFGENFEGEMGIGTNQDQASPVQPTSINNVSLLAAGSFDVVVCTTTGAFFGWGDNYYFKLAQDFSNFNPNTEVHDDSFQGFTSIASAENTTIGLKSDGTVWAVGQGSNGVLGQGQNNWSSSERPVQVTGLSHISQIAGGEYDAFAIDNTGALWAWGGNWDGQLGIGSYNTINAPSQVLNVAHVVGVAAGDGSMLAVQSDGTVWATGDDTDGELGDGTNSFEDAPIQVVALSGITAQAVAVGFHTSFALDSSGMVWAWGKNDVGQLGLGTTGNIGVPTPITGLPAMAAICARFGNAMGIDTSGNVWSWGAMGNSDGTPLMQPGLGNITAIATGDGHQLAIESDGSLWGWGNGNSGQLENNDGYVSVPTPFNDVAGAIAIAANYESSFLVKRDGAVSGLGYCLYGQLGAGLGLYDYSPKPLFGIALNETPPAVSITSPSAGASLQAGTALQFQASATASTGTIAKVDYYLEGVKLGTSTTSGTWNFSYTPASYGDYTFEAVATDTAGVATISAPITVNVPYAGDSDGNGLPDWWELHYFGHIGNDPNSSPDGNGLTLLQDYQQGNDPTNYYSQGGQIITPTINIISGNNNTGTAGQFLSNPLVVEVQNPSGGVMVNAPVVFWILTNGGQFSSTNPGTPVLGWLQTRTDTNGFAQVYFQQPLVANFTSTIEANAGTAQIAFTETTAVDNNPPAAPSNGTITPGVTAGEIDLAWVNNADNATYIVIQQSTDQTNWVTTATLADPTTTYYAVTGLTQGHAYYFRIAAGN